MVLIVCAVAEYGLGWSNVVVTGQSYAASSRLIVSIRANCMIVNNTSIRDTIFGKPIVSALS
jgi:hypothetical protein